MSKVPGSCQTCGAINNTPANSAVCSDRWHIPTFDPKERAREKQASRDEDQRRLDAGEITREELRKENAAFAFPNVRIQLPKKRMR